MNQGMRVELVDRIELLDPFLDPWRELAVASANPFVTPEWFLATLGNSKPLVGLVHDDQGALKGVLALVESRWRGLPVLSFGGAPRGDFFHPVATPDFQPRVAELVIEALARDGRSPRILFNRATEDPQWFPRAGSVQVIVTHRAGLPDIDLRGGDWDSYFASLSRNVRQRIGRMERKLAREHGMRVRSTTDAGQVDDDMATFFGLHDARRSLLGGSSLESVAARVGLHNFCAAALKQGWLRLRFLECEGEPVAAFLGWSIGGRYCFYQSGFDPAWSNRSVGLLSLALAVRDAFEEGAETFDLMLGEEAYKLRLATGGREVSTGVCAPILSPHCLAARGERLARTLRSRIRNRRQSQDRGFTHTRFR